MELKDGVVTSITVEVGRDDENFNVSVIKLAICQLSGEENGGSNKGVTSEIEAQYTVVTMGAAKTNTNHTFPGKYFLSTTF